MAVNCDYFHFLLILLFFSFVKGLSGWPTTCDIAVVTAVCFAPLLIPDCSPCLASAKSRWNGLVVQGLASDSPSWL